MIGQAVAVSLLIAAALAVIVWASMFIWRLSADDRRYKHRLRKGFKP